MKWVTFISFIFLVSSTESKHLPRRSRDAGPHDTIGHSYSDIQDEDFKGVTLAAFVHYVPNITYEDAERMVEDITELGKKCAADEHASQDCGKSIDVLVLKELCDKPSDAEHYEYSECCAKVDHERNECFLSHQNATPGSFPPYQRPEAEASCKAFQEDRMKVLGHFLYEIAKRSDHTSILVLFHTVAQYDEALGACCQAEDKTACMTEKAAAVKKQMKQHVLVEKHNCFLLRKFGPKHLQTLKFVQAAQKFPKAQRSILHNISREIVHIHEERCRGDVLESYIDQIALTKFVCQHQDMLSPKVKGCCEKILLHRPTCIVTMENDEPPADLSPTVREFVDNKEQVCRHYAENHDEHLEGFCYEYARRHQELSPQSLLRIEKGYHDLLEKCCQPESAEDCLTEGEALLKKHIADTLEVIKTNCELYANLGDYKFQVALIVRYARKAPQLSSAELEQVTDDLRAVAAKCCQLDDSKKLTCAEGYTDLVLGSICLRHQEHPINPKICQCCSSNYAFRRECFSSINKDDGYVPAPCGSDLFTFHQDLCTADADVKKRKFKLLVSLVKCKPTITDEQLKTVTTDFYGLVGKCCKMENQEQCFHDEGPELVQRTQAALS